MMPIVNIDTLAEMAIVECAGRFVRNDAAFRLRDAVTSQTTARVVVLDLTQMNAIGGGGLGTLLLLQRWAQDHDIRFQLFNPSGPVLDKLNHVDFEIATLEHKRDLSWFDNQTAINRASSRVCDDSSKNVMNR
jgi:anti-anti-sigma regulatory factor